MIDLLRVQKGYPSGGGHLQVLKGVDLSVGEGEAVAIMGPSGVGKSTLLHLIAGLDRPDAGEILVGGSEVARLRGGELDAYRSRTVGVVYQFHFLLPEFTALENVMIPAIIAGASRGEAVARARGLLEEVSLGPRSHHRPSQLSGGEQQRVSIARALANSPRLLLADEPTGNLDEDTAGQAFDLLLRLKERFSLTVVLATHNGALAAACDRAVRLHDGKVQ